jgi:apolipoprotein N-acyltransferase
LNSSEGPRFRFSLAVLKRVAALVAGAATVLSFAPFGYFPLGIIGPAILFYLWLAESPRSAFLTGLCFGSGLFGLGVSWVYVSLQVYGHMPVPLAALSVLLFVLLLAIFPAMVGLIQARLSAGDAVRLTLIVPALWSLIEWVRGWILTGFPWLSLGYGQIDSSLSGIAPWLGVYGVSWAGATSSGLLVAAVITTRRGMRFALAGAVVTLWLVTWFAGQASWVLPAGEALKTAIVQGNVPLEEKWRPVEKDAIMKMYLNLSAKHRDRDLIVWPEAALPLFLDQLPRSFRDELNRHPAEFVSGIVERISAAGSEKIYNSVLSVSDVPAVYRKQHLVPFGEYVPLSFIFDWIIAYLNIPMSDFSAWQGDQEPMAIAGTRASISICYEDAFADEVRQSLGNANVLINVSEDSWFGDSFAPHQRLDMARMRALENGRPMLRAGNSGISAVIDHNGRVTARTPQFVQAVLLAEVQPTRGTTFFTRFGSWPVIVLCSVIVLITARIRWRD